MNAVQERLEEMSPAERARCESLFTPKQLGIMAMERMRYLQGKFDDDTHCDEPLELPKEEKKFYIPFDLYGEGW